MLGQYPLLGTIDHAIRGRTGRSTDAGLEAGPHRYHHRMTSVPEQDRWPAQLDEPFGFLFARGFRVIDGGTYRLGEWAVIGNDFAGVHLDGDADNQMFHASLLRLDEGRVPDRLWEPRVPRVSLRLGEVAKILAPDTLRGITDLPALRNEVDRAPHLKFWAGVLQAVAM
jgi:hypothetical protein